MICAVHCETENPGVAGLGQVIAETPNAAAVKGLLTNARSVVACNRPVDPMSTSASSAPRTVLPGWISPRSTPPRRVGDEPNGPVQSRVAKSAAEARSHGRPVIAIVPSNPIEIAGYESPLAVFSCVVEKVVAPAAVGSASAETRASIGTIAPKRKKLPIFPPPQTVSREPNLARSQNPDRASRRPAARDYLVLLWKDLDA